MYKKLDMGSLLKVYFSLSVFLFLQTPSFAQNSIKCSDLFVKQQSLEFILNGLEAKSLSNKNFEVQKEIQGRSLPEAIRLAGQLSLNDLKFKLDQALKKVLLHDEVKTMVEIEEGGSEVYLITFHSGVKAIFKPETQYWQNPEKMVYGEYLSNPEAEVYAYQLARIWGLDFVPMTVMRTINGKRGSLQAFVKKAEEPDVDNIEFQKNLSELMVFDYLINNLDRSYRYDEFYIDQLNIIYAGKDVWAIDHGVTLLPNSKIKFEMQKVKDLPLQYISLSFIQNLNATTPQILFEILKDYPDRDVVYEVLQRRDQLLDALKYRPFSRR